MISLKYLFNFHHLFIQGHIIQQYAGAGRINYEVLNIQKATSFLLYFAKISIDINNGHDTSVHKCQYKHIFSSACVSQHVLNSQADTNSSRESSNGYTDPSLSRIFCFSISRRVRSRKTNGKL